MNCVWCRDENLGDVPATMWCTPTDDVEPDDVRIVKRAGGRAMVPVCEGCAEVATDYDACLAVLMTTTEKNGADQ